MKILRIVGFVLLLILFIGCTAKEPVVSPPPATKETNGPPTNNSIVSSYPMKNIPIELKKGFYLAGIHWLNDNQLLTIIANNSTGGNDKEVYTLNIGDGTKQPLFEGEFMSDVFDKLIHISEGKYTLQVNKFFAIDTTKNTVQEGNYYPGFQEANISWDGKKIAYRKGKALFVTDINNKNRKILANNLKEMGASQPKWSKDNKKLAYVQLELNPKLIVVEMPTGKKIFEQKINTEEDIYIHWLDNSERIMVQINDPENRKTHMSIFDIKTGLEEKHPNADIFELRHTEAEKSLYVAENRNTTKYELVLYNHLSQKSEILVTGLNHIYGASFSPNKKMITFYGGADHTRSDLYILTLKS